MFKDNNLFIKLSSYITLPFLPLHFSCWSFCFLTLSHLVVLWPWLHSPPSSPHCIYWQGNSLHSTFCWEQTSWWRLGYHVNWENFESNKGYFWKVLIHITIAYLCYYNNTTMCVIVITHTFVGLVGFQLPVRSGVQTERAFVRCRWEELATCSPRKADYIGSSICFALKY